MSATLTPSRPASYRRLFTVADLAAMPTSLPSGDVRYELDDGELITMAPPGYEHGRRQHLIGSYLHIQAEARGLGEACAEAAVILRRNPDRVVAPDAAFILTASLPARRSPEGYLETVPELVVEIRSKNDTTPEVVAKNEEYFRAGVQVVWVIDPAARTVAAHVADGSVQVFRDTDTLTCGLLPGFAAPVANLFAGG
ncbi:MAG: Uma2 family endonuclease [Gemmataceae bacterium]